MRIDCRNVPMKLQQKLMISRKVFSQNLGAKNFLRMATSGRSSLDWAPPTVRTSKWSHAKHRKKRVTSYGWTNATTNLVVSAVGPFGLDLFLLHHRCHDQVDMRSEHIKRRQPFAGREKWSDYLNFNTSFVLSWKHPWSSENMIYLGDEATRFSGAHSFSTKPPNLS